MPPRLRVVRGDLTVQRVDAIVNAANSSLLGGAGVDGAIHRAGGPAILAECRALRRRELPTGLPPGQAVATTAGDLPARWVIHTVGPVHGATPDAPAVLASCHVEALRVADRLGAGTVAFPAVSCGAYGYPPEEAAPIAVSAVLGAPTRVSEVRFVLLGGATYDAFARSVGAATAEGA